MKSRCFIRKFYITSTQLSNVDAKSTALTLPTDIGMSSNVGGKVGVGSTGKVSDVGYSWLSIVGNDGLAISYLGSTNVGDIG